MSEPYAFSLFLFEQSVAVIDAQANLNNVTLNPALAEYNNYHIYVFRQLHCVLQLRRFQPEQREHGHRCIDKHLYGRVQR